MAAPGKEVDRWSIAHAASFPGKYTIDQPRLQVNKPSNRWYIARIFQIWSTPVGYEELAGGFKANQKRQNILTE